MLPEKSQGKVLQATVVAVGSGSKGKVSGANVEPFLCGVEGEKRKSRLLKVVSHLVAEYDRPFLQILSL